MLRVDLSTQHSATRHAQARARMHAQRERQTEREREREREHSCKPVGDSVHVTAQAMNPINPGVKWWKELCLIAFFGWLTVVELYAIFVGFHNTYTGDSRTFVTFHGGTPGVSETSGSR